MARILVIDDEQNVRDLLRDVLEEDGHEVVEAPDGSVGYDLYRARPADLVITDLIMPNKEGLQTIFELRRDYPEIKIIAMSGGARMGRHDGLPIARTFGALRTFQKPFNLAELLQAVHELLES